MNLRDKWHYWKQDQPSKDLIMKIMLGGYLINLHQEIKLQVWPATGAEKKHTMLRAVTCVTHQDRETGNPLAIGQAVEGNPKIPNNTVDLFAVNLHAAFHINGLLHCSFHARYWGCCFIYGLNI